MLRPNFISLSMCEQGIPSECDHWKGVHKNKFTTNRFCLTLFSMYLEYLGFIYLQHQERKWKSLRQT